MSVDHIELTLHNDVERIQWLLKAGMPPNAPEKPFLSSKTRIHLVLNCMERKYGVSVSKVKEGDEARYLISPPSGSKKGEARTFVVGKYSNEHMMRRFARYLNRGNLSRKNIEATIDEMKSLQEFCR